MTKIKCEYCNKMLNEGNIDRHNCQVKQRHMVKDRQTSRLGLKLFNDWFRKAMGHRKQKTFDEFAKSRYYNAFIRLADYILDVRVVAPERYLEWAIENKIKIDDWTKDSVYCKYLADDTKREKVERALERYVIHVEKWSEKTGHHWTEYWNVASPNLILFDIKMGRISPWIFLGYSQASERVDTFPNEMLAEISKTIDMAYWARKLSVNAPSIEWMEEILK